MGINQGTPGDIVVSDGGTAVVGTRVGRLNDAVVSELWGRYFENTFRRRSYNFTTAAAGVAVAAANNSPLTAATGQPILGVFNPSDSGVLLIIEKLWAATISGTPGGPLWWNYMLDQKITAAASAAAVNGFLAAGGGKAVGFSNTALTGSTVGLLLRMAWAMSAIAAVGQSAPGLVDEGGDLVVPPGGFLGLASTAAGTTHVVAASIKLSEAPFVA